MRGFFECERSKLVDDFTAAEFEELSNGTSARKHFLMFWLVKSETHVAIIVGEASDFNDKNKFFRHRA